MKAIQIDPIRRQISLVDFEPKAGEADYKTIARQIGAQYVEQVSINGTRDAFYIDEEGRINGNGNTHGGFRITTEYEGRRYHVEIAGKALVLGFDDDADQGQGKYVGASTTVSWVASHLEWLTPDWFRTHEPRMEFHPLDPLDPMAVAKLLAAEGDTEEDRFYRNLLGPSS